MPLDDNSTRRPSETSNTVTAVSRKHQLRPIYLYAFAFLTVSLASGLVYGWPSLRRDLLSGNPAEQSSTSPPLSEQILAGIFTAGSWSTQGGRFFFGIARDRYGTRITACISLVAATAGIAGIASANASNGVALSISMFLVGLGSGSQLCVQPVAGLFDENTQGVILSSLSGAFQVSGLIFLTLTKITSDRRKGFGAFAICLAVLTAVAVLVLPKGQFERRRSDDKLGGTACEDVPDNAFEEEVGGDPGPEDADVASEVIESEPTSNKQEAMGLIITKEYIALIAWFSACVIPLQYYIGSLGFQLERKGDDEGLYTGIFSILYASAVAFSPVGGKIADVFGLGIAQALATIFVATSLFILSSHQINLNGQVAGMASYSIGGMMVYGMFFTNVGKRFGYENFGTLAGLGLLISAIASLVQYPLISLAADGHETAVNVSLGVILVGSLPYCIWLNMRERREKSDSSVAGS